MSELLEELKTALAEHYEILQEVGEGGMALVFLARDVKHDRQVAIKILKPELAANLGAERFLREIQITAKLSHPHVLPLYDSGLADGYLYYVMPFVEGEPLNGYLEREKQLPIDEALKITREVAEALAYAHSHGLIHRDIKPDNIFLSRGHAIVADFGIARAVSHAGGATLTQTGMAVGTPAYMSPEQAAGETNLDGRTDIYSLGCVLYEMLVGEIPFTGPNPMAIMARHSMDMITAPHIMRASIPDEVEDIIYTAMAKAPADRFRTAQDMVEAIEAVEKGSTPRVTSAARLSQARRMSQAQRPEAVAAPAPAWRRLALPATAALVLAGIGIGVWQLLDGAPPPVGGLDPKNVAVLYFEDRSPDSALGYLADGITERLIEQLEDVRTLDVRSRAAVAAFRASGIREDSVARALNTGTLVVGAVEQRGGDVRLTVRLVDGESGVDVSRIPPIELPVGEARALQDSVAQAVARELRGRLGQEVRLREQRARTSSDEAWTLVQRAENLRKQGQGFFRDARVDDGLAAYARADSMLRRAEELDPAWVEPTVLRAQLAMERIRPDRARRAEWVARALDLTGRVLDRDPGEAKALEIRGETRFLAVRAGLAGAPDDEERLLQAAETDLLQAVEADASLASAYNTLSLLHMYEGDKENAILRAQRAYQEDAYLDVADDVLDRLFWAYYDTERFQQADRWCTEGRARFPADHRFIECRLTLMMSWDGLRPDPDSAWQLTAAMIARAPALDSTFARALGQTLVGGVLARAGLPDSADRVLTRARVGPAVDPSGEIAFTEAYARIVVGDTAGAIERLRSYLVDNPEQHHGLGGEGNLYWWWRPLRGNPEFDRLARGR